MVSVKVVAFAGMTALLSSAASAADMPPLMPPMHLPPMEDFGSGWYLRGDIGMSNQQVKSLYNVLYDTASSVQSVHKDFESAPLFGFGIGYQWNHWLRFDITGEYRGGSTFNGLDIYTVGGVPGTDEYRAIKSEWLFLGNVYADLGTWYSFTPFVGFGIGGSRNTISSFIDVNTPTAGVAHAAAASKWNFAWALHAGLAYKVNPNLTFEFAYRYVSLGDALTGDIITYTGGNAVNNPMHFRGITSHDFKFGVRWMLDAPMMHKPISLPPLMRRG